jgi:uncharacterized protein YmfQ (DUF2313 family)
MSSPSQELRAQMFARLLPPGPIWNGDQGGLATTLPSLVQALADDAGQVQNDSDALLEDFFPDTTSRMAPDWERVLKLSAGTLTIEQRRQQIISRLRGYGDPNVPNLQAAADAWERNAVVVSVPFHLFKMGSGAMGDPLYGDQWAFTCMISYDGPQFPEFETAMLDMMQLTSGIVFVVRP